MTPETLENLLRLWGRLCGERPVVDVDDGRGSNVHPLARGMEMAPGKRQRVIRERTAMHRAGQDRRAYMATVAAVGGMRMVPAGYVDPVPCAETRRAVYGLGETSRPLPADVARVERAALDLQRIDDLRGRILRTNYCTLGSHEDKVLRLSIALGYEVKLKRYRDELVYSRVWMHGRLA